MITYQQLADLILSGVGVDAEGSGRYTPQNDVIPSINSALSRAIYAGNYMIANRKENEMMLGELQETLLVQSNQGGGITLEGMIDASLQPYTPSVWTVLALIAEPGTNFPNPVIAGPPEKTILRTDMYYVPGAQDERPMQRLTIEQVARARNDWQMPGNEVLAAGPNRMYGFCVIGNRTESGLFIDGNREIILLPNSICKRKLFAMSFLRMPSLIQQVSDTIDMPMSSLRLLADWALEYLSWKQGNGTTLNSVASKDAQMLFNLQSN